jgi:hypothetical protein
MGAASQRALEEQLAEERLRDAAPEMLAALRRIEELCDENGGAHWLTRNATTRALALAAIAKAEGKP